MCVFQVFSLFLAHVFRFSFAAFASHLNLFYVRWQSYIGRNSAFVGHLIFSEKVMNCVRTKGKFCFCSLLASSLDVLIKGEEIFCFQSLHRNEKRRDLETSESPPVKLSICGLSGSISKNNRPSPQNLKNLQVSPRFVSLCVSSCRGIPTHCLLTGRSDPTCHFNCQAFPSRIKVRWKG